MKNLKLMNNACLLEALQRKSLDERRLTIEVIELLEEVERRSLHLEKGYGSLLEFCVRELRYSESAAYRRISTMRVAKEIPQVKKAMEKGTLNLVTVTQAQTFFRQEKKYQAKTYSTSEKIEVLKSLENQSKRAAEKILMEKSPELPKVEIRRQISATQTQVTLCLDQRLVEQLEEIKLKYSHRNPNPTYSELIALMAGEILSLRNGISTSAQSQKSEAPSSSSSGTITKDELSSSVKSRITKEKLFYSRDRNFVKTQHHAKPPERKRSRYLQSAIKHLVFARDGGCCSYQDPNTNKKCGSKFQLEFDHVIPYSMNGSNGPENLRLVCRNHNQFFWKSKRPQIFRI